MSIGTKADFKIYDEEYQGGEYERIAQMTKAFNEGSAGALRLIQAELKGHYAKEAVFDRITGLISRRDISATTDVSATKLTQDEKISVKVNRRVGPVDQTIDSFKKISKDPKEMSFIVGGLVGEEKVKDYVNTCIMCVEAALSGVAGLIYDGTAGTMTHTGLVNGLSKFGDRAQDIACWLMHSKVYFDLMKQAIADKIVEVAGVTIYQGSVATLGRPCVVIDSPALYNDNGSATDTYNTLGLVKGAATTTESEEETMVIDTVTGKENLIVRMQGEYAFNEEVKGFKWDVDNGGENPTDTALATATNWDSIVGDNKNTAGVRIVTQ